MPKLQEQAYQQQEAYKRFAKAQKQRKSIRKKLKSEAAFSVDSQERVATRRALIDPMDGLGLERILGTNDLLSINYLEGGLRAARPVCRIQIRDNVGRIVGFGTGFMVSATLLLTNHHVLESAAIAHRCLAEFEFETNLDFLPKDSKIFRLDPARFFHNNRDLDFALVAVHSQAEDGTPLATYGNLALVPQSGKALVGEPVSIIQHPEGADKQIALRDNAVLDLVEGFIHYETDTQRGSSGSPVLNDQWHVVALHHASVPEMNDDGDILNKDGDIWEPIMGDDAINWIANEGIRISAILRHLQAQAGWQPHEAQLMADLVANVRTESAGTASQPSGTSNGSGPSQVITIDEFFALVDNPETTEEALAPYVVLDEENSDAFAPVFRINRATVVDTSGLEGDRIFSWVNDWARARRHRRYRRKIANGGNFIKIVSEGDSWFQFPVLLKDVIDHLMDEDNLAVFSLGAAGDHLNTMVAKAEYLDAIADENPDYFLISGGGNDLVGGGRLATILHTFEQGRAPEAYLNGQFAQFAEEVRRDYKRLFSTVTNRFPALQILCHGYDHAIPRNGRWLGKPMQRKGIQDDDLQREIVRVVIDRVNDVVEGVAASFDNVTYIDLRGTVSTDGWFDELHPLDKGYGKIADEFMRHIA